MHAGEARDLIVRGKALGAHHFGRERALEVADLHILPIGRWLDNLRRRPVLQLQPGSGRQLTNVHVFPQNRERPSSRDAGRPMLSRFVPDRIRAASVTPPMISRPPTTSIGPTRSPRNAAPDAAA